MTKHIDIQDEVVDTRRGVPQFEENPKKGFENFKINEYGDEPEEKATNERSANIEEFDTGSIRDSQEGKPRYDLIPSTSLKRLAQRYADGAELYGDNNWKKGQPFSRVYASLFRHLIAWRNGEEDEDHMAAVAWNAMALMHFEEVMPDLDDLDA